MMYLYLAGGLVVLLVCGDLLVRGAVALAMRLGVPHLIVGLTVVAFGTSAPELMVSINAAFSDVAGISLGNVVGSNIANILLVLGLPAIIYPTCCDCTDLRSNMLFMLAVSVLFIALCFTGVIGFWEGLLLLALLVAYLGYSGWRAATHEGDDELDEVGELPGSWWQISLLLIVGIVGLPLGAHFIVTGGTDIARAFGVSDALIGITLIALGTSLPELATTLMAAFRKHADVAVGNVIGSNIFNLCGIIGITAMLTPLPVPPSFLRFDLWVMLIASLAILPVIMARGTISRLGGAFFVLAYLGFIAFAYMADKANNVPVAHL